MTKHQQHTITKMESNISTKQLHAPLQTNNSKYTCELLLFAK